MNLVELKIDLVADGLEMFEEKVEKRHKVTLALFVKKELKLDEVVHCFDWFAKEEKKNADNDKILHFHPKLVFEF